MYLQICDLEQEPIKQTFYKSIYSLVTINWKNVISKMQIIVSYISNFFVFQCPQQLNPIVKLMLFSYFFQ